MSILPEIKADLTPLIQSIPNGVEKIFNLFFGTKISKQEAAQRLIQAQAKRNADLIENGFATLNKDNKTIDFNKVEENNIYECIEFAIEDSLNRTQNPPLEDISKTFFYKWREYAKTIDEYDIKKLWGKLLSNEIYTPNSISLKTLNTLSLISKNEIDAFINTTPYIIKNGFILADFIPINTHQKIFNTLQNINLITEIPKPGFKILTPINHWTSDNLNYFYIYKNNKVIAFHSATESKDTFSLQLIELTNTGKELYKLTDPLPSENEILLNSINKETILEISKDIYRISIYQLENNEVIDTILEKDL